MLSWEFDSESLLCNVFDLVVYLFWRVPKGRWLDEFVKTCGEHLLLKDVLHVEQSIFLFSLLILTCYHICKSEQDITHILWLLFFLDIGASSRDSISLHLLLLLLHLFDL